MKKPLHVLEVPSLLDMCREVLIKYFLQFPVHDKIPAKHMRTIAASLPTDLNVDITAKYIFDELYWELRCKHVLVLSDCDIRAHAMTWKQLFFENHVQMVLEKLNAWNGEIIPFCLESLKCCKDYIFTLKVNVTLRSCTSEQH
mmetsp:Transcript_17188/g.53721  ORF Transcript_17188/g.53721 Transcript_17188/m.53721 type:complete len:143 (+) Transcript_17188:130-558(+)